MKAAQAASSRYAARMELNFKRRADRFAHLWKAALQQHHGEMREAFRPYIPEDGVVIDVGAHAGQFSKLFARMAPRGRVYAFEPSAYARSILQPALAFNRIRNVDVVPMGLSDAPGESVLKTPVKARGGLGFGIAHLGQDDGGRTTVDQSVSLTTLDAFMAERGVGALDFVKADVEGWELHVLRGGLLSLERFKPALFLEVMQASLERAGSAAESVWDLLRPLGYRSVLSPAMQPCDGYVGAGDYLFTAR